MPQQRGGKRSRVCVALRLCLLFSVFVTITARVLTQRALLRPSVVALMNSELINHANKRRNAFTQRYTTQR